MFARAKEQPDIPPPSLSAVVAARVKKSSRLVALENSLKVLRDKRGAAMDEIRSLGTMIVNNDRDAIKRTEALQAEAKALEPEIVAARRERATLLLAYRDDLEKVNGSAEVAAAERIIELIADLHTNIATLAEIATLRAQAGAGLTAAPGLFTGQL